MEKARQHPAVRLLREVFLLVGAVGIFGFLACFGIGSAGDFRLKDHPEYLQRSAQRPVLIHTKYADGYVEASYAERFQRSERLNLVFWGMILIGGLGWSALKKDGAKK